MNMQKRIDRRINFLLAVFGLWLLAVLLMLLNIGVFQRAEYLQRGDDIAVRQFFLPPQRGWILDQNRTVLAWSARYYDLLISSEAATDAALQEKLFNDLQPILPDISSCFTNLDEESGYLPAYPDLTVGQLEQLKPLLEKYQQLKILPRIERQVYDHPAVRKVIGDVESRENCLVGMSGLEREYDKTLSGTAEIYEIMVDKYGRQLPATLKVLQPARKGSDVILPFTIDNIIAANTVNED